MRTPLSLTPAIQTARPARTSSASSPAPRGLRQVMQRAGAAYRELLTVLAHRMCGLARLRVVPGPAAATAATGALPDPSASAAASPAARRHVILFLAANPDETTRLALDEECAAIERELRMTTGRDDFDFRSRWAVSVDEVMRSLNELQPTIIHFSGHGGGSDGIHLHDERSRPPARRLCRDIGGGAPAGIQLQDERQQPQHVSARALAQMIASAAPSARLVVLNACYSDAMAEELRGVVDCVVGMRGAIGDAAARSFAVGFYRALGHRRSIGNAVEQAVATLAAKRLPDEHLPICRTRDGVRDHELTLPQLDLAPW